MRVVVQPARCRRAARAASRRCCSSRRRTRCRARPRAAARRAARRCRRRDASRLRRRRASRRTCRCTTTGRRPGRRSPGAFCFGVTPSGRDSTGGNPSLRGSFGALHRRRRHRRRRRERRRLARLRVRLRVPDLDLALRRQAAVVGGQRDVERGDEVVMAGRRLVDALALLLERDRVAPVGERDRLVRRRRHRLAEHDEPGEARDAGVAGCARRSGARVRLAGDALRDDLALEERERRHLRRRARARLDAARRGDARRDGARATIEPSAG